MSTVSARTLNGPIEIHAAVGEDLGVSDWITITQDMVDAFADVTGDHQWIHVDAERAAGSPWGSTIAHGLLTLSVGPDLTNRVIAIEGFEMGINYGYERVRFPAPVKVGSRIRLRLSLNAAEDLPGGGVQIVLRQTFEGENLEKPVCVADAVSRWV